LDLSRFIIFGFLEIVNDDAVSFGAEFDVGESSF